MPNQRSSDKKILSAYIDKHLKQALVELAAKEGKTLTELCSEMFEEAVRVERNKKR
jgi:predicted HicB family RNase H-like nuclease